MLTTEDRFSKLLVAAPETLSEIDALLEGSARPSRHSLRLMTIGQTAKETEISRTTIWRMIRSGNLRTVEIRPGTRRVPQAEVERLVAGGVMNIPNRESQIPKIADQTVPHREVAHV